MRIAVAFFTIWALVGCAKVVEPVPGASIEVPTPVDMRLNLLAPTTAPFAYTLFCVRYSVECEVHEAGFEDLYFTSPLRWNDLTEVNDQINRSISPNANGVRIGFDAWRIAPPSGNCNDFAVTKRHELLARGWPSRSLLLAEVVTRKGEHHLVLLVRSDSDDVVLDNLTSAILDWSETPYHWVRVQSPDHPGSWVTASS